MMEKLRNKENNLEKELDTHHETLEANAIGAKNGKSCGKAERPRR